MIRIVAALDPREMAGAKKHENKHNYSTSTVFTEPDFCSAMEHPSDVWSSYIPSIYRRPPTAQSSRYRSARKATYGWNQKLLRGGDSCCTTCVHCSQAQRIIFEHLFTTARPLKHFCYSNAGHKVSTQLWNTTPKPDFRNPTGNLT